MLVYGFHLVMSEVIVTWPLFFPLIKDTGCIHSLIGHFHDGVLLLQLPEFISFSFSNANFVIPVESKEQ